uniref:Uncharacterized protein n=1 Tax=Vitis vinifera TaxID=29760 RepID=A5B0K1_VITVI|nr:hypothetical protein VITISV_017381 [Vitis vinifera]
MGGNLAIVTQLVMIATNNYVDISFTNENDDVEFYDEDEINEKNYDDEPPTNKASLNDGQHIMPSPINPRLRRVLWNPWQGNGKLRNIKNRSFEVLCHKHIRNSVRTHHRRAAERGLWHSSFHPDVSHPESARPTFYLIQMYHSRHSARPTFYHPDVSHPEFCSADIPPGCITSGILLC